MAEKSSNLLKPAGSRLIVIFGLSIEYKSIIGNYMPFRPILLALNTPTYKFAKLLVPVLKPLTTFEFRVKNSFHFAKKIVDH